jgi:hypothetical protein
MSRPPKEIASPLQFFISHIPGISVMRGCGVIGKHPYACVCWYRGQWMMRLWKTGLYRYANKVGFKWSLDT